MSNKPVIEKQEKDEILLKIVPPVDRAYIQWLVRDLEMIHGYAVRNCSAVKPPDHYIEYMHLNGWLNVDMDDPDLVHLFQDSETVALDELFEVKSYNWQNIGCNKIGEKMTAKPVEL